MMGTNCGARTATDGSPWMIEVRRAEGVPGQCHGTPPFLLCQPLVDVCLPLDAGVAGPDGPDLLLVGRGAEVGD